MKIIIFCLALATVFLYFIKNENSKSITNLQHFNNINQLTIISNQEMSEHQKIINNYNKNVKNIKNFSSDLIKIRVNPNYNIKVNGTICYEKANNFRLVVSGLLNRIQEVDLGSNHEHFWFWSKDGKALFYAKHEDFKKSLLKTPLNPKWIIETFNLNEIEVNKQCQILKYKEGFVICEPRLGTLDEPVTKITLFNKENEIIGHYLYDKNDKVIISTEIIETYTISNFKVPKKIIIQWREENIYLEIDIYDPKINEFIDPKNWTMPNINPKVDLGV